MTSPAPKSRARRTVQGFVPNPAPSNERATPRDTVFVPTAVAALVDARLRPILRAGDGRAKRDHPGLKRLLPRLI
jgi:hypothetical protein